MTRLERAHPVVTVDRTPPVEAQRPDLVTTARPDERAIAEIQRTAGNRAATSVIARRRAVPQPVQRLSAAEAGYIQTLDQMSVAARTAEVGTERYNQMLATATPTDKMTISAHAHRGQLTCQQAGADEDTGFAASVKAAHPEAPRAGLLGLLDEAGGDDAAADAPAAAAASPTAMNCWESIAHLANKAGLITGERLAELLREGVGGPANRGGIPGYLSSEGAEKTQKWGALAGRWAPMVERWGVSRANEKIDDDFREDFAEAVEANLDLTPGRILVYQVGGVDSHYAYAISKNEVVSLNGAGQALAITTPWDFAKVVPSLLDPARTWADIAVIFDQDDLSSYKPPWDI